MSVRDRLSDLWGTLPKGPRIRVERQGGRSLLKSPQFLPKDRLSLSMPVLVRETAVSRPSVSSVSLPGDFVLKEAPFLLHSGVPDGLTLRLSGVKAPADRRQGGAKRTRCPNRVGRQWSRKALPPSIGRWIL